MLEGVCLCTLGYTDFKSIKMVKRTVRCDALQSVFTEAVWQPSLLGVLFSSQIAHR